MTRLLLLLRLGLILRFGIFGLLMAVIRLLGVKLMQIRRMMTVLACLVGNFVTGCLLLFGILLALHHPLLIFLIVVVVVGRGRITHSDKLITRTEKEIGYLESRLDSMETKR